MTSRRIRTFLPLLKHLQRLPERAKKQYIKTSDKQLLDAISECCVNILNGCIPLTPAQKEKLRRNKSNLRKVSSKKTSLTKKRAILQKGGFLSSILTPALSLLGGLLTSTLFEGR